MIISYNTLNSGGKCNSACRLGCNFPLVPAKQVIIGVGLVGTERERKSNPSALFVWRLVPSATGPGPVISLSLHCIHASFCFLHYVSCVFSFFLFLIIIIWNLITLPPFIWWFYASSVWIAAQIQPHAFTLCLAILKSWLLLHIFNHWLPVLFLLTDILYLI